MYQCSKTCSIQKLLYGKQTNRIELSSIKC